MCVGKSSKSTEGKEAGEEKMGLHFGQKVSHDWIVPRRVMCAFFWIGIILVFTGLIVLVTGKHKDPETYSSWGGVLLGLGFTLLLICLILCLHAYCVITFDDAKEGEGEEEGAADGRPPSPPSVRKDENGKPLNYNLANSEPVKESPVKDSRAGIVESKPVKPVQVIIIEKERDDASKPPSYQRSPPDYASKPPLHPNKGSRKIPNSDEDTRAGPRASEYPRRFPPQGYGYHMPPGMAGDVAPPPPPHGRLLAPVRSPDHDHTDNRRLSQPVVMYLPEDGNVRLSRMSIYDNVRYEFVARQQKQRDT